jgi:hypothetical protein
VDQVLSEMHELWASADHRKGSQKPDISVASQDGGPRLSDYSVWRIAVQVFDKYGAAGNLDPQTVISPLLIALDHHGKEAAIKDFKSVGRLDMCDAISGDLESLCTRLKDREQPDAAAELMMCVALSDLSGIESVIVKSGGMRGKRHPERLITQFAALTREVTDVVDLAHRLRLRGLQFDAVWMLATATQMRSVKDSAGMLMALNDSGMRGDAEGVCEILLNRDPWDVIELLETLQEHADSEEIEDLLRASRGIGKDQVVSLVTALRDADRGEDAKTVLSAQFCRSVEFLCELMDALKSSGQPRAAELILRSVANSYDGLILEVLTELRRKRRNEDADTLLTAAKEDDLRYSKIRSTVAKLHLDRPMASEEQGADVP